MHQLPICIRSVLRWNGDVHACGAARKGSIDRSSNPETCKTISAKGWEDKGNDAQVGRATGPRLSVLPDAFYRSDSVSFQPARAVT